jgi:metallopeptidase MepB
MSWKHCRLYDLLGKSKYAMFHGHRTVSDFSEATSQLLEYWCWVPECLCRLSCHYFYLSLEYYQHWVPQNAGKDTARPPKEIPDKIIHNLVAAKQLNQGILTLRQVAFSKFDMKIHNPEMSLDEIEGTDISKLYNSLLQEMTGLQWPEDRLRRGHGYATTSHYVWGQEGDYYSYF